MMIAYWPNFLFFPLAGILSGFATGSPLIVKSAWHLPAVQLSSGGLATHFSQMEKTLRRKHRYLQVLKSKRIIEIWLGSCIVLSHRLSYHVLFGAVAEFITLCYAKISNHIVTLTRRVNIVLRETELLSDQGKV